MRELNAILLTVAVACAAPIDDSAVADDPLSTDGKADGEPWCSIESVSLSAPFTVVELPSNACHDRTSTRAELGSVHGGSLAHPVVGGGTFSLGCTLVAGETDIAAPVRVEARVFSVPIGEGARVTASLGSSSRATLDLLVARTRGRVTTFGFVEHGTELEIDADGTSAHTHEKHGERFVVLRVRPRRLCPREDHVDFELRIGGEPLAPARPALSE